MFLHLGGDVSVSTKELIAILDMSLTARSGATGEYLKAIREDGLVKDVSGGSPKSIVITDGHVYLSAISPLTLKRRAECGGLPPEGMPEEEV
ncbi:MAG TPA: DUF370 domain-containing protein [Firmicutes bacterium]|nr:DUF370 domain-containing protein [Bacillota bacterium]